MSVLGRTKFANSRARYYWGEDSAKQQREGEGTTQESENAHHEGRESPHLTPWASYI